MLVCLSLAIDLIHGGETSVCAENPFGKVLGVLKVGNRKVCVEKKETNNIFPNGMRRFIDYIVVHKEKCTYIVISLVVGGVLGAVVTAIAYGRSDAFVGISNTHPVRENSPLYNFINPLLECDSDAMFASPRIRLFEKKLTELISERIQSHEHENISVYFRDLNNGPWYGISQDEPFTPASLVKVPVLIALLKQSEQRPELLSKKVTITSNDERVGEMVTQNITPFSEARAGNEYTVLELIELMITQSDNVATNALLKFVDNKTIIETFSQVGVPFNRENGGDLSLTVRQYAAFFRVLYNASYLSREYSELALSILARSSFVDGITKGVPKDVVVAHKFGERKMMGKESSTQLHDCGIVYYPKHPYLLCVMSRGNSLPDLEGTIQEVSKIFYEEVDQQFSADI